MASRHSQAVPVDTSKGEQHLPAFRAINPNGKVPAIVDTEGPGGEETRVFDSTAILLYLAEKIGKFPGTPEDRPELLSWLLFIASGLGPFSGQAVHFQFAAPEGLGYAINRYRRQAERHYQVLNDHLAGRRFIVGSGYTIADMSAWGWLDRASRVMKGAKDPLAAYPNLKRFFQAIDGRPAVQRARAIGQDHEFKKATDEETKRALFPSNYRRLRAETMDLQGKRVLVTGGSSGIGLAIAKALLAKSAKVAISGRRSALVSSALAECVGQGEKPLALSPMSARPREGPRHYAGRSTLSTSWSTTPAAFAPAGWRRRPRSRSRRC
jgi:GST-like protein